MQPIDLSQISPDERALGGWISPDGLFFQAEYGMHDYVAGYIVDHFLALPYTVYLASDWLVDCGWIRLETTGKICHHFQATEQQASVLYRCYMRARNPWYAEAVWAVIYLDLPEVPSTREPMQPVPSQGDQENMRLKTGDWLYV